MKLFCVAQGELPQSQYFVAVQKGNRSTQFELFQ